MAKTRTQSPKIPAAKVFDISTRRMAAFIDVPIMDPLAPADAPVETGMVVRMRSPKSEEMKAASMAWYAEHAPDGKLTNDKYREFKFEMSVAATESWSGFVDEGKDVPCTPENVRAVYGSLEYAWIGEQAAYMYGETSSFFAQKRAS